MEDASLEVTSLFKAYGERVVFNGFSHRFPAGFHGVTGPNGVGKSTLLALLAGAEPFQRGTIRLTTHGNPAVLGDQPDTYRAQMGYAPDRLQFYPFLSVGEFWRMAASARNTDAPDPGHPLVTGFKLEAELDTRLDALSLGTRKKVLLISALMHDPLLLLLDEPSDELDAGSAQCLLDHLRQRSGITIVSTHDVDLLEDLAARVIALDE